jgi:hypothetical protein
MATRFLAMILFAVGVTAPAQWLNYPTSGVPRTPNGVVNLGAPAPRTADGKPDLSGIWQSENTLPCDPNDGGDNCTDVPVGIQLVNIAANLKEGLPYQPWAAALVKKREAEQGKDAPDGKCLPMGPRLHTNPLFRKYIQTQDLVVILSEYNATYRQIFTDGRPLPADPNPAWDGYSTGRWEGDILVVESSGYRDDSWLDVVFGNPMTNAAKITERFHRLNYGNMEIEMTVDDPKAYTKPWTVKFNQYLVINTDLMDYICLENEKDVQHIK